MRISDWSSDVCSSDLIADACRPSAHQHDGLVPRLLQAAQYHDLDEAADMQRRRGCVETDISGDDLFRGKCIEPFRVGDRKSTRRTPVTNAHLVCRLLLEKTTITTTTNRQ